jgi:hypothetical protein
MKTHCLQSTTVFILLVMSGCSVSNPAQPAIHETSSVGLAAVSTTLASGSPAWSANLNAGSQETEPAQQMALCKLFDEFNTWQPPPGETNPIKAAAAPRVKEPDWNTKMHDIMGEGAFVDWKGVLHSFAVVPNKEISITVDLPSCGSFSTTSGGSNHHYGFKLQSTQPKLGSEISNALSTMQFGDNVTISGKMFYWKKFYVPLHYGGDDFNNDLWPAEYHPDIGKRITFGGHFFVVRFDKISK